MKILYLECNMGAAGDMIMGALYELLSEERKKTFLNTMNGLGLNGVTLSARPMQKCGIWGTKIQVSIDGSSEEALQEMARKHLQEHQRAHTHEHPHEHQRAHTHEHPHEHQRAHTHEQPHEHQRAYTHEQPLENKQDHSHGHHHNSYPDILHQISHLQVPEEVKEAISAVYRLIGEAEAKVHQTTLEQIHFHEVGTMDAIADVAGCCLLIHMLEPEKIVASPVHVGSGFVQCAHGTLPVPAPATAELLQGIPIYSNGTLGELCTPTGAAILKYFTDEFSPMPEMEIASTGYGMGTKDFKRADHVRTETICLNCIRAFLGNTSSRCMEHKYSREDTVLELSCNLDDMTGEALGFATDLLMKQGALDVFTTSVGMKKNRPGTLLTCLCRADQEEDMSRLLFMHTSTRGIRIKELRRHVMKARFEKVSTPYGDITVKISTGYGIEHIKPEYDEVALAAHDYHTDFDTVYQAALRLYK